MTDIKETRRPAASGRPPRAQARKRIRLPNGDELWPRGDLADELDINERTIVRMNLPTTRIGGAAYLPHDESLTIIASRVRRPNQEPPPRRRKAR